MKRILLVAAIALVTLGASAVNRSQVKKARFAKERKTYIAPLGAFKSIEAKAAAMTVFNPDAELKTPKVAQAQAVAEVELIPAYSLYAYYYSADILGGALQYNMYDGASFLVDGEKAYLAPFADLGYVEGVMDETADNPYEQYGSVVYKFTSDVIATSSTGEDLSLEPGIFDYTTYTVSRSGEKTFYAYYFAENDELYIPDPLALFYANNADTEVFGDHYVALELDLEPQETFNKYISKGTFTGASWYEGQDVAGDCQILLTSDSYFIKGANGAEEPAWIEYILDEDDLSKASVDAFQYTGGPYRFSTKSGDELVGAFINYGVGESEQEGYVNLYRTIPFKITDNSDGTTTITDTDDISYGDLIYNYSEDGIQGIWNIIDLNINILYEPAFGDNESGIKGVTAETNKDGAIYNLAGQRVSNDFKGIAIKNGKKFIVK
ncbi:MAG: hypothetical protein J1E57_02230 [Prevotella sp.]|nr:hypothetical protein [Prevotella sp.]